MSKEKKYVLYGLIVILIAALGTTLAYFVANIVGDRKPISVNATNLKITFNKGDDGSIEASDIEPGSLDITKTFSITNETNTDYSYNLIFKDYINTFKTTGFLVYKVTSTDGGYNMTDFADMPKLNYTGKTVIKYSINLPANSTHNYTIQIKYLSSDTVDQSDDMEKEVTGKIYAEEGSNLYFTDAILRDNPTISERTDFSVTNVANTTGTIYKTNKTEDGSDVYYYSGNTTNNWVKFGKETRTSCTYNGLEVEYVSDFDNGQIKSSNLTESECTSTNVCNINDQYYYVGFTESQCTTVEYGPKGTWVSSKATYNGTSEKDIYWRIVRTNEDKSVRLLYSGLDPATTSGYIGTSAFNTLDNENPMYVGYMYGTSGSLENNRTNTNDSTIKKFIDTWYENNLLTNYDKYISKSAIYCNDRSVGSGTYNTGNAEFYYGAYTRLNLNKAPSYKCGANASNGLLETTQALADKFSASTTGGGNGKLKYPIALMTADEFAFAGGKNKETFSSPYAWYYTNSQGESIVGNSWWWSLSPYGWSDSSAYFLGVNGSRSPGSWGYSVVFTWDTVRPAISLDSCVQIKSGEGTPESPYEIDYENSCS